MILQIDKTMNIAACTEQNKNKIITASESNRKFIINNPNEKTVKKIKVDGCLITNTNQVRCDYMFKIDIPYTKVIYLELKGKNIEHACEQLKATIKLFEQDHSNIEKDCHIVASRVPKLATDIQQLKVQFKKQQNAKLSVGTMQTTISI